MMEERVPESTSPQLVTPAKAVGFQPIPSAVEPLAPSDDVCDVKVRMSPALGPLWLATSQCNSSTAGDRSKCSERKQDSMSKKAASLQLHRSTSNSSSISSKKNPEQDKAIMPKHGHREAWRYPGLQATSSYSQLTTVGCCHQYTISGYALAKALGPGVRMCSDCFEAGGQQFRLEVYPAGISADAAHHVSIFLTTCGQVNPNHVITEVAVLDQSGRSRHLARSSKPRQGPLQIPHSGIVAGYPWFVRGALLEKHARRYLLNDSLIVRATVEVVRSWGAVPHQLTLPDTVTNTAAAEPQNYGLQQIESSMQQPSCISSMQECTCCCKAVQQGMIHRQAIALPVAAGVSKVQSSTEAHAAAARMDPLNCCCCAVHQCSNWCRGLQQQEPQQTQAVLGGTILEKTACAVAGPVAAFGLATGEECSNSSSSSSGNSLEKAAVAAAAAINRADDGSSRFEQQQQLPEQASKQPGSACNNHHCCCYHSCCGSGLRPCSLMPLQVTPPAVCSSTDAAGVWCSCVACLTAQLHQLHGILGLGSSTGHPMASSHAYQGCQGSTRTCCIGQLHSPGHNDCSTIAAGPRPQVEA